MRLSRQLIAATLSIAVALCIASGSLIWLILLALGWTRWWAAAPAVLVAMSEWNDGRKEFSSWKRRRSHPALDSNSLQKFFGRQIVSFFMSVIGGCLGYAIGAAIPWTISTPKWLNEFGVLINKEWFFNFFDSFPPDCPGWWGIVRYVAAFFGSAILDSISQRLLNRRDHDSVFRRGRKLLTQKQAQILAARHTTAGEPTICFGGIQIPDEAARTNICIVGSIGSGKSLTLAFILEHACSTIGSGRDHRAIIFDPKRDMIPRLHGMNIRARIYNLNPFDTRSVAWWVAKDCNSVTTAMQIAATLIPEDEGANRFFSDAGREIVTGEMLSLMKRAPNAWTLRDVLMVLRNQDLLSQILGGDAETRDLCQYFDEPRTYQNIRSCIASKVNRFSPIAACWDQANESLALSDWILSESILVLGFDPSIQLAMQVVNRAIYQRLSELLLAQNESTERRVWHIADEAKVLGRLALPEVTTFGRGAGNRVVIGFQDIEGLRSVYGREAAHELTGECATKAFLRLDSPETAAWASQVIADAEVLERRRSGMKPENVSGGSITEQLQKRETVLPGELLDMPATNRRNGLTGYYLSPFTGVFRSTITAKAIDDLTKPDASIPGFMPRPPEHQVLRPFDAADYKRLGLRAPRQSLGNRS
ncbi:MAG TPA: type IV secretion system DNA-binding domain-containing protein [Pirellulales bacterium]|jgi:hypothetical protein